MPSLSIDAPGWPSSGAPSIYIALSWRVVSGAISAYIDQKFRDYIWSVLEPRLPRRLRSYFVWFIDIAIAPSFRVGH